MASVNESLDPLDLELSRIRNEVTGKDVYALVSSSFTHANSPTISIHVSNPCVCERGLRFKVNRREDEIARIASDYSPLEISYFRALVRTTCPALPLVPT